MTSKVNTEYKLWHEEYNRYLKSPQWKKIKHDTEKLTWNRCILFPWLPAQNVHHMHYGNIQGEFVNGNYHFVAKKDSPFKDVVPLSKFAHSHVAHLDFFWKNKARRKKFNKFLRFMFIFTSFIMIFFGTLGIILGFTSSLLFGKPKTKGRKKIKVLPTPYHVDLEYDMGFDTEASEYTVVRILN